jgi:hypothetical protein
MARGTKNRQAATAANAAKAKIRYEERNGLKRCFIFDFSQRFIVRSALIKTAQWPEGLANLKDH